MKRLDCLFFRTSLALLSTLGLFMLATCSLNPTPSPTATSAAFAMPLPTQEAATLPPTSTQVPATIAPVSPTVPSPTFPESPAQQIPTLGVNALEPLPDIGQPDLAVLRSFSHIYVIVMENREYGAIIGNPNAPYLDSLAAQYGLGTNYTGVAHPSEPNYFALFSGSTNGVTDDDVYNLAGPNIADQIEAAGKTWRVFAENVPGGCFPGVVATGGEDGQGTYARKHEPAISFNDIADSPARCANIVDFSHFDPAAANYEFIVPNLCHDMHDCSVGVGDTFLKAFVPLILNSDAWQKQGILFIVWDEGTSNIRGGGQVPLLVISKRVKPGLKVNGAFNHYSLLRTIEDVWGLPCLNRACGAHNLAAFFR